jgi:hypothetical protein
MYYYEILQNLIPNTVRRYEQQARLSGLTWPRAQACRASCGPLQGQQTPERSGVRRVAEISTKARRRPPLQVGSRTAVHHVLRQIVVLWPSAHRSKHSYISKEFASYKSDVHMSWLWKLLTSVAVPLQQPPLCGARLPQATNLKHSDTQKST